MRSYASKLQQLFIADRSGAAGIEYALIAGAIAITIIGSIQFTAVEAKKPFENAAAGIIDANP